MWDMKPGDRKENWEKSEIIQGFVLDVVIMKMQHFSKKTLDHVAGIHFVLGFILKACACN